MNVSEKRVVSSHDARIQRIRALQTREERERTGQFFADGLRFVIQAEQRGAPIESLLYAPALLSNSAGQRLVHRIRKQGIPCLEVTPSVFQSVSLSEEPQGVGAVVRQHWEKIACLRPLGELCWIAVEEVQSAGNLGTILRTSEAVGGAGIILIGNAPDPYDPATVRASMGAIFCQRIVRTTLEEFAEWKRHYHCQLVGTSLSATNDYHHVTYPAPVVLLMGNERKGLTPEAQGLCDLLVKIPMVGKSDSLNVAIATSVLLYELFNQHRNKNAGKHQT